METAEKNKKENMVYCINDCEPVVCGCSINTGFDNSVLVMKVK